MSSGSSISCEDESKSAMVTEVNDQVQRSKCTHRKGEDGTTRIRITSFWDKNIALETTCSSTTAENPYTQIEKQKKQIRNGGRKFLQSYWDLKKSERRTDLEGTNDSDSFEKQN